MSALLAVIEDIVVATVISEKVLLPRKSMMDWAFMALSILLGIAGVALLILSLDRFLEKIYPEDIAALILAGVVFTAAFLAAAFAWRFRSKKASNISTARHELGRNIHSLIEGICDELDDPVRDNPKTAMLLAAVAGFMTAQQTK